MLNAQEVKKPPYDLERPDRVIWLPDYLEEVSGLSMYGPQQLAMHHDEKGRMFVFDLAKEEIVQRVRFEGSGDFEGIEKVGDFIYAIKSNGKLYRFHQNIQGVVEELDTPFDEKNNVEGIGFDPQENLLLFALKGSGDTKDIEVKGKAIYGYDLTKKTFRKFPIYALSNKELKRVMGDDFDFSPSAIAVHPISREVYVLSAKDRALLIFGTDKKPKSLTALKSTIFPQPEGIAFNANGDLYISNEQEGEGGTLLWFRMIK